MTVAVITSTQESASATMLSWPDIKGGVQNFLD
jgi:hypothetical protein